MISLNASSDPNGFYHTAIHADPDTRSARRRYHDHWKSERTFLERRQAIRKVLDLCASSAIGRICSENIIA
jgi:hypothetical protein